jgi:predicted DCC family thiol-disulfide oxidoreductase YuxK
VRRRPCSQPAAAGGKKPPLANSQTHPVILFDGVCNLCNGAVQWIIRRDPQGIFHFATLQSRDTKRLETIILLDGEREFRRSTAFLHVLRRLPQFKWLAFVGATLPEPIRDLIYDVIAKNRYRWFGKTDQCMIPSPEISKRFET